MTAENPTLEDFGFDSKELMIEVQRETMGKLIKAEAEIARLRAALEKEEKFTMAAMDKAKAYRAALEEIVQNGDQGIHVPGPYDIAKAALAKEGK